MTDQPRIPHDIMTLPNRCWLPSEVVDGVQLFVSREWDGIAEKTEVLAGEGYTKPRVG